MFQINQTFLRRAASKLPLLALLLAAPAVAKNAKTCTATDTLLDEGWSFHAGESVVGQAPADASWRAVELPHDWAIQGPRSPENKSGGAGGYAPMGVGWYRRVLPTPAGHCARVVIRFDGVMAHSEVWVNGHSLGRRPNGYVSFEYDLTPFLKPGPAAMNELLVRADNSQQPSSRFYQGAGIYRNVHLRTMPAVHLAAWSTFVTTPRIDKSSADVRINTDLVNEGTSSAHPSVKIMLRSRQTGQIVSSTEASIASLAPGSHHAYEATLKVAHPELWNLDSPRLYEAIVAVRDQSGSSHTETVPFGIRETHFEPNTGFWINGRNLKIKGVALHSDIGALGMAAPRSLVAERLLTMKRMGANAVRTAHNPVDPTFLDLCDELGLLVLDEFFDVWTVGKNPYDYHLDFREWAIRDLQDTVRRDRNHPSIIAWSAGNEIHDTPHPEIAKPILASLVQAYHSLDPTRPVTQALFRPNASHDYDDGLADMLDVIGQNYRPNEILAAHEAKPTRKILGTENTRDREAWLAVRDHPAYSGMFLWAGADYLGESRKWPLIADASGLFDRTGFPKAEALEHESWWSEKPVVYVVRRTAATPKAPTDPGYELEQYRPAQTVFHDWTPSVLTSHTEHVEVYSNCAQVRLSLNGNVLGEQEIHADASPRTWDVAYDQGTLEARCADASRAVDTLHTAGAPQTIRLVPLTSAHASGFENIAAVRAFIVDRNGTPVPTATNQLTFSLDGPGFIVATDDADTAYHAPFEAHSRAAYHGRAVVYIRRFSAGPLRLSVSADGLAPVKLEIDEAHDNSKAVSESNKKRAVRDAD